MPSKKNRLHTGPGPFTLAKAQGIPDKQSMGHASESHVDLPHQLAGQTGTKHGKGIRAQKVGYDVKTRVSVPAAKSMGKASRVSTKKK